METQTLKASDMKTCECGHLAHEHPMKVAPASKWRDKCSKCPCKRYRTATNKQVDGKWVPDTKVVVTVEAKKQAERDYTKEWLERSVRQMEARRHLLLTEQEPVVLRVIWPQ